MSHHWVLMLYIYIYIYIHIYTYFTDIYSYSFFNIHIYYIVYVLIIFVLLFTGNSYRLLQNPWVVMEWSPRSAMKFSATVLLGRDQTCGNVILIHRFVHLLPCWLEEAIIQDSFMINKNVTRFLTFAHCHSRDFQSSESPPTDATRLPCSLPCPYMCRRPILRGTVVNGDFFLSIWFF